MSAERLFELMSAELFAALFDDLRKRRFRHGPNFREVNDLIEVMDRVAYNVYGMNAHAICQTVKETVGKESDT